MLLVHSLSRTPLHRRRPATAIPTLYNSSRRRHEENDENGGMFGTTGRANDETPAHEQVESLPSKDVSLRCYTIPLAIPSRDRGKGEEEPDSRGTSRTLFWLCRHIMHYPSSYPRHVFLSRWRLGPRQGVRRRATLRPLASVDNRRRLAASSLTPPRERYATSHLSFLALWFRSGRSCMVD